MSNLQIAFTICGVILSILLLLGLSKQFASTLVGKLLSVWILSWAGVLPVWAIVKLVYAFIVGPIREFMQFGFGPTSHPSDVALVFIAYLILIIPGTLVIVQRHRRGDHTGI